MEYMPSPEEIQKAQEMLTKEQQEQSGAREEARKDLPEIEGRVGDLEITETGEVVVKADKKEK